jgi:hypothetical protein
MEEKELVVMEEKELVVKTKRSCWTNGVGYGGKGVGGYTKSHWCFFVVARNN